MTTLPMTDTAMERRGKKFRHIKEPLIKSLARVSAAKFPSYFTKSLGNTFGYSLRFLFYLTKIFLAAPRTGNNQWFPNQIYDRVRDLGGIYLIWH